VAFAAAIYIRQVIAGLADVAQEQLPAASRFVSCSPVDQLKISGRLIYETTI
jgi:hypothetical protein